jgi:tRNA A37 N6-isopentenylltransferase MiaA
VLRLAALSLSAESVAYLEAVRLRRCSQRLSRALEIVFLSSSPPPPLSVPSLPELPARLQYDARCVLLTAERSWLCRRLDFRCEEMIKDGLLEETRSLAQQGGLQASSRSRTADRQRQRSTKAG